jgi:hypothetical protein
LTHSGVGTAVQKRLSEQLSDMVAQPGGNLTTYGESELTGIADLLRGHQKESSMDIGGQTPTPHKQGKCTTLRECKKYDLLVKRHGTLVELHPHNSKLSWEMLHPFLWLRGGRRTLR